MGLDHFCIPFLLNQDLLKSSQQNYIPFFISLHKSHSLIAVVLRTTCLQDARRLGWLQHWHMSITRRLYGHC